MKLTNKIYLLQFISALLIFIYFISTYYIYNDRYNKDILEYSKKTVQIYKNMLSSSYEQALNKFMEQEKLYINIHQKALEILKDNGDYELQKLKEDLKNHFKLTNINLELFLIDSQYVIYDSTFKKDIGLDLGNITDAKEYLDLAQNSNEIFVAKNLSEDALDLEYKQYSYSKLDDNRYFEIGFTNKSIKNTIITALDNNKDSKNIFKLYKVGRQNNKYIYYNIEQREHLNSKKDVFDNANKIDIKNYYKDYILTSFVEHKQIQIIKDNTSIIISPVFDSSVYGLTGIENMILEISIDISSQVESLKKFKIIFLTSLLIVSIFLLYIFFYIKKIFTNPVRYMVSNIDKSQTIDIKKLDSKEDELAQIAQSYNQLFDRLNIEIYKNNLLLDENKIFISDMVHQIRTPLTVIMANTSLIEMGTKQNIEMYIEQINAAINMLSNSYEDLSYYISHDSINYKPLNIDLSLFLHNRINFFNSIANTNNVSIEIEIQDRIIVYLNDIELERIIDNNISNGIKHTTGDFLKIKLYGQDNSTILQFITQGMRLENPLKIFERNYTESKDAKRNLGLGLNIVKNICEKYNITYNVKHIDGINIFEYIFEGVQSC